MTDTPKNKMTRLEPVAWLRYGEKVPVQNVPFGAMWITDKDDPRGFPVYADPPAAPPVTGLQYRPNEFDDWGQIRNPDGSMFASVRRPASEQELAEHRRNKTDPYEDLARRLIASFEAPEEKPDPALIGVAEEMKESGGCWQPCSGCYDTEDGHPTQKYAFSPALQTDIGCGCHECGGLGAVWWHMTDEEVANFVKICEEVDREHQLNMRVVRLEAALRRSRRAYVSLMETGRDRIISLGGSCDPVEVMEAADPELRLIDAALATTEGSEP